MGVTSIAENVTAHSWATYGWEEARLRSQGTLSTRGFCFTARSMFSPQVLLLSHT